MCVCTSGVPSTTAGVYSTIEGGRRWLPVDPKNNSAKSNWSSRVLRVISFVFCCMKSKSPHWATSWIAHLNTDRFAPSHCLLVSLGDVRQHARFSISWRTVRSLMSGNRHLEVSRYSIINPFSARSVVILYRNAQKLAPEYHYGVPL